MESLDKVWLQAALSAIHGYARDSAGASEASHLAATLADKITHEYDTRFGELAQILKHIPRCTVCKKETNSNEAIKVDGHNFCNNECAMQFLNTNDEMDNNEK